MRWLLLGIVCGINTSALAQDIRSDWFKSLMRPDTGTSCCDVSDCHKTHAEFRRGQWHAQHQDGSWTPVPSDKIVSDPTSLDGDAYLCESAAGFVYCFIPPTPGS